MTRQITGSNANGLQTYDLLLVHDSWGDGNDNTGGQSGTTIRDWTDNFDQLKTGSSAVTAGDGGDTLADVTLDISNASAVSNTATTAVILCGLNDVANGASLSTLETRLQSLITEIETEFPSLSRYIICTIPPPHGHTAEADVSKHMYNHKLLTGQYDSYTSNTVHAVDLDGVLSNTTDPFAWKAGYENASTDHPNETCSTAIYDEIHRVLVNGYTADSARDVIGFWTDQNTNTEGLTSGYAYSSVRESGSIVTVGDNTVIHQIGVFCRSGNALEDEVIELAAYEVDTASSNTIGSRVGSIYSTIQQAVNSYKGHAFTGLELPTVSGNSYVTAFEHSGVSPRVVSDDAANGFPATSPERSARDNAGLQATFVEDTRAAERQVVWGLTKTLIGTPVLSTAIPKQAYTKDSAISPLNLTGYIDGGVSFSAANLPTGLGIDEGVIYGTPTADEINTVTITATSATGTTADFDFVIQTGTETATTSNIPLTIQAGYTLVDLVSPDTTNASLLFGVTGGTPVTGDHLEYTVTSTLDANVSLSVAATGVWTVTETVEGAWVTDITVSRRVVQVDGTIGTEAVLTLQAASTGVPVDDRTNLQTISAYLIGQGTYNSTSTNTVIVEWLADEGYTGQFNKAFYDYLEAQGFSGSLSEKMRKWRDE